MTGQGRNLARAGVVLGRGRLASHYSCYLHVVEKYQFAHLRRQHRRRRRRQRQPFNIFRYLQAFCPLFSFI